MMYIATIVVLQHAFWILERGKPHVIHLSGHKNWLKHTLFLQIISTLSGVKSLSDKGSV